VREGASILTVLLLLAQSGAAAAFNCRESVCNRSSMHMLVYKMWMDSTTHTVNTTDTCETP
jgi:hypothetical protein